MKNFDALKQMPLKNFASMVFNIVTHECKTEADFEKFLDKEVPEHLEKEMKEALQEMQCSDQFVPKDSSGTRYFGLSNSTAPLQANHSQNL